jgi:2-(1,2-epoxy-1,2-dihydrophenyl)acetyl-CoA isomerase
MDTRCRRLLKGFSACLEPAVRAAKAVGYPTSTTGAERADRDSLALREGVLAAEHDPAVRCLVLRGGEHFMAGGDLKWFSTLVEGRSSGENRVQFEALIHEVHTVILALRRMPKPVLASVRGAVAGFGMSLMMACDLALAADSAYFTLAYTLIGASPDGGSTFSLPRIVGQKKAMEIALLGERFDAATAEGLGLVNRVVPLGSLEIETTKLAFRLAAGPTAVYARTKALLNGSLNTSLESQLQREAEAFAERPNRLPRRISAFIEKRKPRFTALARRFRRRRGWSSSHMVMGPSSGLSSRTRCRSHQDRAAEGDNTRRLEHAGSGFPVFNGTRKLAVDLQHPEGNNWLKLPGRLMRWRIHPAPR